MRGSSQRSKPPLKAMTVAGIMSGTSADGIDVAIASITPRKNAPGDAGPKLRLLLHCAFKFPPALRRAVLAAMDAPAISTAELARLNWRLGIAYAEALRETLALHKGKVDLVGCHGQTIYHQATPAPYAGRSIACTWQIGETAMLAAEARCPVVSNFRPADMVAGGQGAPLVPLLDHVLFRHAKRGRVLQNIGGISNLTAIPPAANPARILAFDTGPGNMVIDALMQALYKKPFDRGGRVAAKGRVLQPIIDAALRQNFFTLTPPKSAGREQFGAAFTREFLRHCARLSKRPEDTIATATALTAESIALAYRDHVKPHMREAHVDYVLSGGGAENTTLISMMKQRLAPLGCTVMSSDDLGLPAQAKEAVAFALLAWQTWHHLPGNIPAATGATRPAILGQITYV